MLKKYLISTALASSMLVPLAPSMAQQSDDSVEEIIVTGSYIRRPNQANSPSPISVVGSEDFNKIGAKTVADLVQTMTFNSGSENNPDAFTQNATTGTSNFNLRGLGVASTLVLLNGRRQVVSGAQTNQGLNFVDTSSLIPSIAIDRIEVVKDGAAATYGSDAVAGVVNFITNKEFEGFRESIDFNTNMGTGSQRDLLVQGMFGVKADRAHFMIAGAIMNRSSLTTAEKRLSRPEDDSSAIGAPGSYFTQYLPANPAIVPGGIVDLGRALPIIDPTGCAEVGGIPQELAAPINTGLGTTFTPGFCKYDYGDHYVLVPQETRYQVYGTFTYDVTDTTEFNLEAAYTDIDVTRSNSPSFPYLRLPIIPATHPENPFGIPVAYFGRVAGNGFNPGDYGRNEFTNNTFRLAAGIESELNENWHLSINGVMAKNHYTISTPDTVVNRFNDALLGFGGPDCNKADGAGVGSCYYFNPFATALPDNNDTNLYLMDYIMQNQLQDINSKLISLDAVVAGDLWDMDAGTVQVAFGVHTRHETYSNDYDAISNADGFGFLQGNQDYGDSRDATAVFAEMLIPITDKLETTIAGRYETYSDGLGSTFDPKVAYRYAATEDITLRASISTSYRAASIFQSYGGSTSLNQVLDPITSSQVFAAIRTKLPTNGARDLKPETSTAYNMGVTWQPENLEMNLDFFMYDFKNVITPLNYQSVVNADPQNTDTVVRAGDPLTGPIIMVLTDFVNATKMKTSGFDFNVAYNFETDIGIIRPSLQSTYITKYDITDPIDGLVKGAGSRNFTTLGNPMPKLRTNLGLSYVEDAFSIHAFLRRISKMTDDQNPGRTVPAMETFDIQGNFDISGFFGLDQGYMFTVGLMNAFDKNPPQVWTNGGYESKVHDPRGRMGYIKVTMDF